MNSLKFTLVGMLKFILLIVAPKLFKLLRIPIFDAKSINYFKSLVYDAMKYREALKIVRPDMIHLLIEAQRNFEQQKDFNDEDLLAQCMLFFFAGFETVSTALSFTAYEHIMNLDVQERFYGEILAIEAHLSGAPLNYDMLMNMKYLDMVVSESLRKWPPGFVIDRICSSDVDLKDEDGQVIATIKKDDTIQIPVIGLHHDPDFFCEPEKFDPERFSDENKMNIKPFSYLPFGIGPRSCIANRMALMEVKSVLYYLLLNFKLLPTKSTPKDMINRNMNVFTT